MAFEIGVVCGRCDRYSVLGAATCPCGHALSVGGPSRPLRLEMEELEAEAGLEGPPSALFGGDDFKPRRPQLPLQSVPVSSGPGAPSKGSTKGSKGGRAQGADSAVSSSAPKPPGDGGAVAAVERQQQRPRPGVEPSGHASLEELMEQAKNYVCKSCSTPVPMGHKFCGRCGAAMPPEILNARTQFFGQLQVPGRAKLILIRGDGVEGLSYQLNAEQHVVGRNGQLVFPDDPFVSPRHANLFYRNGKLVVRDEGSLNGVFWRVSSSVELIPGDYFLAGEQLFRVEGAPRPGDGPAPDGTYFYTSPKHQTQFKIVQVLEGGAAGMAVCARTASLQIGREGGDLNFPSDLYMSASHCRIDESGGKLTLTDLNSRNGTYVRLKTERELGHGDYLFIGRKLLRVEITAN
jgi:pSer/pThr/pTyr-binding forkhead associated (FHA) protein